MLVIDLAVPRDIEEDVGEVDNVYLYNIDDLERIAAENLARRHADVEQAWKLVREEAVELGSLFETEGFATLMREFDEQQKRVVSEEQARVFARQMFATLTEAQRQEIADALHRVTNKLLAAPRHTLRVAAKGDRWDECVRITRDLFAFDGEGKRRGGTYDDGDTTTKSTAQHSRNQRGGNLELRKSGMDTSPSLREFLSSRYSSQEDTKLANSGTKDTKGAEERSESS
jgi:hypothetical protein